MIVAMRVGGVRRGVAKVVQVKLVAREVVGRRGSARGDHVLSGDGIYM